jgi:hypothetical protein
MSASSIEQLVSCSKKIFSIATIDDDQDDSFMLPWGTFVVLRSPAARLQLRGLLLDKAPANLVRVVASEHLGPGAAEGRDTDHRGAGLIQQLLVCLVSACIGRWAVCGLAIAGRTACADIQRSASWLPSCQLIFNSPTMLIIVQFLHLKVDQSIKPKGFFA